jgi:hypothetical protein
MPIHKMTFEGNTFNAKAVGYFDNMELRLWANALNNHANTPIVAVLDMVEVSRLCPTVTKIFTEAFKNPNMRGIALVISDSMASQNMRVIDKLGEISGLRVFMTDEEAHRFASARLSALSVKAGWNGATVSSFAFLGSY